MNGVLEEIEAARLLPVVVIDDPRAAPPLAAALKRGGLPVAEITLRTAAAEQAIGAITAADPDMLVGAGTVLNAEQAARVIDGGARFVVTPGLSIDVVRHCRARSVPVIPGIATATELMAALDLGIETVKFFPAEQLGGVPDQAGW